MALTTNQVNAAYLAVLGRPAEGSAAAWASNYSSVTAATQAIIELQKTKNADFVDELYASLLNRTADAGGKKYWTDLLDAGQSKESVEKQFIASIIAQGQEDPYNVDFVSFKASTFVSSLYSNILSKAGDADGIAYWGGRLAAGLTRAELTNEFINALVANPTTDDGQLFAAKEAIAEKFTTTFEGFSKLVPAEKQAEAWNTIKTDFANITTSSSADDYTTEFDNFKAEYQDIASQGFTRGEDHLTSEKSTALYVGTVNIADPSKGTIQSTDTADGFAGSKENSITVNVDGYNKDTANTLNLNVLEGVSGIQQVVINNGSAGVTGTVKDDVTNLTIVGAAAHAVEVSSKATTVNINSAAKTEVTFSGEGTIKDGVVDAVKYTGAAGNDNVNVKVLGKSDFGAGNDKVTTETIASGATISLGNGDDTLTLTGSIAAGSNVTIDGGSHTANGGDTLVLSGKDYQGLTIKNFETIKFDNNAELKADQVSGQTFKFDLTNEAPTIFGKEKAVTTIDFSKVATTDATAKHDIGIYDIYNGSKITLNKDDKLVEKIFLKTEGNTSSDTTKFTVTGLSSSEISNSKDTIILRDVADITSGYTASEISGDGTITASGNGYYFVSKGDDKSVGKLADIKFELDEGASGATISVGDFKVTVTDDSTSSGSDVVVIRANEGVAVYKIDDNATNSGGLSIKLISIINDDMTITHSNLAID